MNVSCPSCHHLYRVDPERVPEQGVRTRCSSCAAVFHVGRNGAGLAAPPGDAGEAPVAPPRSAPPTVAPRQAPPPAAPPPTARPTAPDASSEPTGPTPPPGPSRPPSVPSPSSDAPRPPEPRAGASGPGGAARPVFGEQDPDTRARRIARALISDIVAYHAEDLERSRAAGTLRPDFRDEILKSWEEYTEQVGVEFAKKTPFFRDALNQILAAGKPVF